MHKIYRSAFALLLFFFFQTLTAFGQGIHSIRGRVVDKKGFAMMGNVQALAVKDSSLLLGGNFLEGDFILKDLVEPSILVKLTSIQFADTVFYARLNGRRDIDLGNIVVKERTQELNEVEIISEKPLFITRGDGVVQVNVANTILATSSSLTEILSRTPGVIADDNGLSVVGKGQAILFLNGKRISPERLSSVSPAQVKSVEIISNPPASFDAEGQAVINIITWSPLEDGYRVTVNQQLTWSAFAGGVTQTLANGSLKKGRFELLGNFDLKHGKDRELLNTTRVRESPDDYLRSRLRWDADRDFVNVFNYSLGASYAITTRSYASLEYNGFQEQVDELWQSQNRISTASEESDYTSRTERNGLVGNNSIILNVHTALDTLGSMLFTGGQFSRYRSDQDDNISEYNVINGVPVGRPLQSDQNGAITILSPQVDYIKVTKQGRKVGLGGKLSYAHVGSDLTFYNKENSESVIDAIRSNEFLYKEIIPAAYAQFETSINTITTVNLGIRSELTQYQLRASSAQDQEFKSQYFNVFPQTQFAFAVSPDWKLRASYNARIIRPRYQALSPTLIYQDTFTSTEGNPNLVPEKVHAFEVGTSWRILDMKAGYTFSNDRLAAAALRGDSEKSYVLKGINVKSGHLYFVSASAAISNRLLTSNNTFSVNYERLVDQEYEFVAARKPGPQFYVYSNSKVRVGGFFSLQILAWYYSEKYYSLYHNYDRWLLTLGIEREFLKKSLKFSLTANDIFHSSYPDGDYYVGGTNIIYARKFTTNYYRLAITYSFGHLKKSLHQIKSTGDMENSRAR